MKAGPEDRCLLNRCHGYMCLTLLHPSRLIKRYTRSQSLLSIPERPCDSLMSQTRGRQRVLNARSYISPLQDMQSTPGRPSARLTVELRSRKLLCQFAFPRDIIPPAFDESRAAPVPRTITINHKSILEQPRKVLVRGLEGHIPGPRFTDRQLFVGIV
jgi:hypothetical protein